MSFQQEVNLYLPHFRTTEIQFSAKTIAQSCGVITLALAAITIFSTIQLKTMRHSLETMKNQEIEIGEQVLELEQQKKSRKNLDVYRDVEALKHQLEARQTLVGKMGNQQGANVDGFSNAMKALATQHIEGLWLTKFEFIAGGNEIKLDGGTTQASLVPNYVNRLKHDPAFTQADFGLLKLVNHTASKEGFLRFSSGAEVVSNE